MGRSGGQASMMLAPFAKGNVREFMWSGMNSANDADREARTGVNST